jgi:hypothetical protein
MTLTAPARVMVVPVAASAALGALLAGAPTPGALLGAGRRAAWARAGDTVVVIGGAGGVRMPNGVALPEAQATGLLRGLAGGDPCSAGDGRLAIGDWDLRPVRWWDPRPTLPRVARAALRDRVASSRKSFAGVEDEGLGEALAAGDPATAVLEAAQRLIGKGPGLTPLGDDVLAGAVAASLLLGEATGHRRLCRMVAGLAPALCAAARERTTALAATLLRHACRGEVDDASAALLRALCGRGDPATALDTLRAMGHTSGAGLATGLLAGAAAAAGAP